MTRIGTLIPCFLLTFFIGWTSPLAGALQDSQAPQTLVAEMLRSKIQTLGKTDLQAVYKEFGYRLLWVRDADISIKAKKLLEIIGQADAEGLNPTNYKI